MRGALADNHEIRVMIHGGIADGCGNLSAIDAHLGRRTGFLLQVRYVLACGLDEKAVELRIFGPAKAPRLPGSRGLGTVPIGTKPRGWKPTGLTEYYHRLGRRRT